MTGKFDSGKLDPRSYNLGMIYAFAECVGSGVKRLALSPALTEAQLEEILGDVRLVAEEFGLVLHIDRDFLETRLFNPEYTRGRIVVHIAAKQETIDEYLGLKDYKGRHEDAGTLTDEVEVEVARRMGRLLSYSDEAIEGLLERPRF
jgi:hypothetical protein